EFDRWLDLVFNQLLLDTPTHPVEEKTVVDPKTRSAGKDSLLSEVLIRRAKTALSLARRKAD
ncbi:MAG TPA: hypothetical protein VJU59_31365, partial [Paraburkholderia sp.]|nr:hypothetical protein [Paraburkholderia sp.]